MTSFTITVRAAPSTADNSLHFLRLISWPMTTWPTPEPTRSVSKTKSCHAIWCRDPLKTRHSTRRAEERAGNAAVRSVLSAPLIATSERWPLDDQRIPPRNHGRRRQKPAETPRQTHEGPADSKNRHVSAPALFSLYYSAKTLKR